MFAENYPTHHCPSGKAWYTAIYQALWPSVQDALECQTIAQRLLDYYLGVDAVQLLLDEPITITSTQQKQLSEAIQRLSNHEPLQYILGEANFFGRDFCVTPAVLIPRPETEYMVQHILEENTKPGLQVLDIGTGSGCIAITLQKELLRATVSAIDISASALRVAEENASQLDAKVQFWQADVLNTSLSDQRWDVIVSNPPYICMAEKDQIHPRILSHEPAEALFVPDERPLLFYEKIASLTLKHLVPGGSIYLEINEKFGEAVANLLTQAGLQAIAVKQDLCGKDRWVQAIRSP